MSRPNQAERTGLNLHPKNGIFGWRGFYRGEKPLDWLGSSKKDFLAFPDRVKHEMGNALGLAQFGGKHPSAKPWKGQGPGVFELVDDFRGDTYRAVYTVRF